MHGRVAPTCTSEIPLLNGPTPIPDLQITASSQIDSWHSPQYARLHNTAGANGWCPSWAEQSATPPSMYLQVSAKCEVIM